MRALFLAAQLLLLSLPARAGDIPDLALTPGTVRSGLTREQICSIKWGRDERHVTAAMKREIFLRYGYSGNDDPQCVPAGKRRCEVDHLVSRELGGADEIDNLWPQAYGTSPWNAVLKDKLENRLHKEMCAGSITLEAARQMLVNDWREAYRQYYGAP
ncbi:HNH endonuclease [Vogesella facilis]|uniref:HNH endonuclease n=1 Tax=Vogesella facilis TaxID=1655232 RepID=A0ABV7RGG3_9NEIS